MNFGMIRLNQNINEVALNGVALKTEQNYVTQILTSLLLILKLKIFIKTLLMMFKNGLTHLIMMKMIKDRFQQVTTKLIGVFKDELGGKIMKEFVALRAKTYSYLMDDDSEHKKSKRNKEACNKKKTCLKIIRIVRIASLMISHTKITKKI